MSERINKNSTRILFKMLVISTVLLAVLAVMQPVAAQVTITIEDIGTLGGNAKSYANDINDDGLIVGTSSVGEIDGIPTLAGHAFIWRPDGNRMTDLGTLGGSSSIATSINELGQVVGYSKTNQNDDHAFLWTQQDRMIDLETLGGRESKAGCINNLGQVVGQSMTVAGEYSSDNHAFLWTPTNDMMDLGTLGGSRSYARGINDFGQVVGSSENLDGKIHAFLLTPEDTDYDGVPDLWYRDNDFDGANDLMIDLDTLGGSQSSANSINDLGDIVGSSHTLNSIQACLWPETGGIVDLCAGQAHDINNLGQVVGYTYGTLGKQLAFYWTEEEGIIELSLLSGSTYSIAMSINNIGRIAGVIGPIDDDHSHPVQWRTTEPADRAHERVEQARQRIQKLIDDGLIGRGHGRALIQKLDTIERQLIDEPTKSSLTLEETTQASNDQVNKGNTQAAIKILESFKHQVNAYMKSGSLSQEDGEILINDANAIIASLGG